MSLAWSVIHSPSLSTSETCKWVLSPQPLILRILESFLRKYPAMCFCSTDRTHRCRFSWERTRQCVVFSCHGNSILYSFLWWWPMTPTPWPIPWLTPCLTPLPTPWLISGPTARLTQDATSWQFYTLAMFSWERPAHFVFFWERTRQCGQTYASFVKKNKSDSSVSWSVSNTFEELNIIKALYKGFWLSRIVSKKDCPSIEQIGGPSLAFGSLGQ